MPLNITSNALDGNPVITFSGLASGMDTSAIVRAQPNINQGLQDDINQQATILSARQTEYNNIGSALQSLDNLAQSLTQQGSLLPPAASSSDPSVVTAAAGSTASPADYTVVVTAVAAAQSNVSEDFTSATQAGLLNPGTLNIQVGTSQAPSYITVDSTSTLSGLAATINSTQSDVSANVINDSGGYRLQVTAKQTGTQNALQFSDTGTGLNLSNNVEQAAQNASLTLNNSLNFTSQTNTFSNAIHGVTLQAVAPSATAQTVTIGKNSQNLAADVQNLVTDYNAVQSLINNASAFTGTYSPTSLIGDPTLHNLQNELQSVLGAPSANATGTYSALSQLGISTQSDGSLQLNTGQLQTAIVTDPQSVAAVLSNSPDNATVGVAGKIAAISSSFGDPNTGILSQLSQGISQENAANQQAIEDMQNAANTHQSILKQTFVSMEMLMSKLQSQNEMVSAFAYQIDGAAANGLVSDRAEQQVLNNSIANTSAGSFS